MHSFDLYFLISVIDEADLAVSTLHIPTYAQHMDSKTLEKLSERSYCKDFQRLGLGVLNGGNKNKSEGFRISSINSTYSICRRYTFKDFFYFEFII